MALRRTIEKRHEAAMAERWAARKAYAEREGWDAWDERPDLLDRWRAALSPRPGSQPAAVRAVAGEAADRPVTVFDYTYRPAEVPPNLPRTVVEVCFAVSLPAALPLVEVAYSRIGTAQNPEIKELIRRSGTVEVADTGDAAYDETHIVTTDDTPAALRLLTPRVRDYADEQRLLTWRVEGDALFYRPTWPATGEEPDLLDTARILAGLVDLVDETVWPAG